MREKAFIGCALVLFSLIILTLIPSVSANYVGVFIGEEDDEDTFLPVKMLMKNGYEFGPKAPKEHDADTRIGIPNGFVATSPGGRFGYTEYRTVGIWKTDEVRYDVSIQGTVQYSLWCYWEGGSRTVDLRIGLRLNGELLDWTQQEILGAQFEQDPKQFTAEFEASSDNHTLIKGDVLELLIEGSVNANGGKILYGGYDFRSGVQLNCNSLRIRGMEYHPDMNEIRIQVTDSFGLSPYLLNPQLFLDDILYPSSFYTGISDSTYFTEIIFPLDEWEEYYSDEHTAQVVVSYEPDSDSVSKEITFEDQDNEPLIDIPWRLILKIVMPVLIISLGIIAVVLLVKGRKCVRERYSKKK